MREHYDFLESVKNPYAKKLKKQVTIRLDEAVIFNSAVIPACLYRESILI
nr:hypothetical protein [Halomonas sp.]